MRNNLRRSQLGAALALLALTTSVQAQEASPPAGEPAAAPTTEPAAAGAPQATASTASRANIDAPMLSGATIWGVLVWNGVGAGARYMVPVGIPSLLTRTPFRDSWAIEGGLDFVHRSDDFGIYNYSYNELIPAVGMMWMVWFTPEFAAYPKIDGGWMFGFSSNANAACTNCTYGGPWIEGAAGVLYKVSGGITLRAELSNYGVKGGLAWLF
jgi:hypothetical protein